MLKELECNNCRTRFFYDTEHTGAVCPKCHRVDDYTVFSAGSKVDLEADEWGDYGTNGNCHCRGG